MSKAYPIGFARVTSGVFRSGYPKSTTCDFMIDLNIKTIISLNPDEIKGDLRQFCATRNIGIIEADIGINQEPFVSMSIANIQLVVDNCRDVSNHPCLIFCTNGKLRTSCAIGCLRKSQQWSMASIIAEYEQFVGGEGGLLDIQFIEKFPMRKLL